MQVSIIIINFNTFKLTCECIQSVVYYTHGLEYEIILVDNASDQCEPELFKKTFPFITLVKSKKNLGFSGGNNLGMKHATGEFILLLNSDTLLTENSILHVYSRCSQKASLGAASIQLRYPDGRIQRSAQKFPSATAHFLFTTRLYKLFKKRYQRKAFYEDLSKDFECDWVWGTFFFFPAGNLAGMGGKLPETYFMYSEDVEWCYHFKKLGLKNYHFGTTKMIHLHGESSVKTERLKMMKQNRLHFIKNNFGHTHYLIEKFLSNIDALESRIRIGIATKFSKLKPL